MLGGLTKSQLDRRSAREARFKAGTPGGGGGGSSSKHTKQQSATHNKKKRRRPPRTDDAFLVGTSTVVEKEYLRLTDEVDPSKVRPLPVLRQALSLVSSRLDAETCTYAWASEQLRSIRQDLTVQGIKTAFTVEVYKLHARTALEEGDLDQLSSTLAKLKELFRDLPDVTTAADDDEFTAYRVLVYLYRKQALALNEELSYADSAGLAADPTTATAHALRVVKAWNAGDWVTFSALHPRTPNMGVYLVHYMLHSLYKRTYRVVVSTFSPSVPVSYFKEKLGMMDESLRRLLEDNHAVFLSPDGAASAAATAAAVAAAPSPTRSSLKKLKSKKKARTGDADTLPLYLDTKACKAALSTIAAGSTPTTDTSKRRTTTR